MGLVKVGEVEVEVGWDGDEEAWQGCGKYEQG